MTNTARTAADTGLPEDSAAALHDVSFHFVNTIMQLSVEGKRKLADWATTHIERWGEDAPYIARIAATVRQLADEQEAAQ